MLDGRSGSMVMQKHNGTLTLFTDMVGQATCKRCVENSRKGNGNV